MAKISPHLHKPRQFHEPETPKNKNRLCDRSIVYIYIYIYTHFTALFLIKLDDLELITSILSNLIDISTISYFTGFTNGHYRCVTYGSFLI